ncbi:hypothetical protein HNQ77_002092 [Silvibacterium bohemicum]|uniref:Uncharacterized protein n=1 Tax=Silvibacterium bohemicum TaxID=1577686 RepID=A0A841JSK9_9BACT|nr:hypothetical protein [Silvibacterium bohemicum]MBB6144140.1 hypothetical protein [Silvibacterium bohemicum]
MSEAKTTKQTKRNPHVEIGIVKYRNIWKALPNISQGFGTQEGRIFTLTRKLGSDG